jgi:hypothetical protein
MEGSKVRIIHAGYDRTVPACKVMPLNDEKSVVEDDLETEDAPGVTTDEDTENVVEEFDDETSNRETRPKRFKHVKFQLLGEEEERS